MSRWVTWSLLLALPAAASASHAESTHETVRGITISTHTDGRDWGSVESMAPTLREIRALGAGWVAIHPYAGIRADGTVRFRPPDAASTHLAVPIRLAHEAGLKILIKPHLAYWGSPFAWRGDIAFEDDEAWARFFATYEQWIVALARATREADGFVVGTELDRTLAFEREWRGIVARVRDETDVPLTYAANWTDYERVPFWDALDVVGIQAYFPLAEGESVTEPQIRAGWQDRMRGLRAYSQAVQRPIVFTELGYSRSFRAPIEPWSPHTDGEAAAAIQQSCMRIALAAIHAEPTVLGAFLWKWFPGPRPNGRNFRLADPGMRRVIADAWAAAAPPLPGTAATRATSE